MNFKNGAALGVERKGFALDIKTISDDGLLEGYGSTFGNVDQGEDIVAPGAFTAWINTNAGKSLPMLFGHRTDRIAGVWTSFSEDSKGLFCRGQIIKAAPTGAEVYALAKAGAVTGLSIGYRTRDASMDHVTGVRTLKVVDLKEISMTAFPMNEEAQITRVKSEDLTARYAEKALRDAGFSRTEAKAIIAAGFKTMPLRDAGGDEAMNGLLADLRNARTAIAA